MSAVHEGNRRLHVLAALQPEQSGVARLVLGGRFGEQPTKLSYDLLNRFYVAGGRLVETASAYADGMAERELGAWLSDAPGDVVCITKVGHPAAGSSEVRVNSIRGELEHSAARLGLAKLDVALLHRDDESKPVEALMEPLMTAREDDMVAAIGVANWRLPRLREAAVVAQPVGGLSVASAQLSLAVPGVPLWPGTVHADKDLVRFHAQRGLPLLAWSANARGWFAGALSSDNCADPDARRSFNTITNLTRLQRCRSLALELGASATATALAWTLRTVPFAFPAIGPSSLAELEDTITATELCPSKDQLAKLSTS